MKLLLSLAVAASLCATAFSAAKVGTNMGGWLVLEPWITPSLFYRFLGKTETDVGMDAWTLCEALGAVEGNKLMRAHWDSWVTEEHIKGLADRGVELVRLPVGDWTLRQYGPYTGCMDGAEDYIQWFLDTAHKYDLDVLLDVHAVKDSQNGFDNSGQSRNLVWTDPHNFQHWDILTSDWMGAWNGTAYESINQANMAFALQTVEQLLDRWGAHPALYALEPVNEPWWNSDMPALKTFYRQVRALMQRKAPLVTFVFHDAFQLSPSMWNDLFEDTDKVVMDTHFYTAWYGASEDIGTYCDGYGNGLQVALDVKYDVWVGEWSLATDVCAMWLGGFNDNNAPYVFPCGTVPCPVSYLPAPYNADFDRTAESLGPYGSNAQTVHYGQCSTDSTYFSDAEVTTLGYCAYAVFDDTVQAHFLWNFRNEIEPKWSYVGAYDKGWIPHTAADAAATATTATTSTAATDVGAAAKAGKAGKVGMAGKGGKGEAPCSQRGNHCPK